jgi:hypothetical protein
LVDVDAGRASKDSRRTLEAENMSRTVRLLVIAVALATMATITSGTAASAQEIPPGWKYGGNYPTWERAVGEAIDLVENGTATETLVQQLPDGTFDVWYNPATSSQPAGADPVAAGIDGAVQATVDAYQTTVDTFQHGLVEPTVDAYQTSVEAFQTAAGWLWP